MVKIKKRDEIDSQVGGIDDVPLSGKEGEE